MEWTDESISRLRSLWQEGLSTAEIGRRMQVTKNAVVGKAHRLELSPRPSPIRKPSAEAGATVATLPRRPAPAPRIASEAAVHQPVAHAVAPSVMEAPKAEATASLVSEAAVPLMTQPPSPMVGRSNVQALRPQLAADAPLSGDEPYRPVVSEPAPLRSVAQAPRRRGLSCCWPLGEPGTKEFHFCGGEPIPNKPYCSQHAALAYVKLRDRRESVA